MKRDHAMRERASAPVMLEEPAYPWGLEVNLDNEGLDRLKVDPLPEVGETMLLMARVRVTRVSSTDNEAGGKQRNIALQITDMGLEDGGEKKDAATTLYEG